MKKRIAVITGAGGFIGSHITHKLLKQDIEVHVLWKPTTNPWRLRDIIKQINFHEIPLTQDKALKIFFNKIQPHIIINLASYGNSASEQNIKQALKINTQATASLLESTCSIPYDIFLHTGSSSEYGWKNQPMKETDVLEPNSLYAATKAAATHLCMVYAHQYNKPISVIRPFSIYGPGEESHRFIPTIISRLINNKSIDITANDESHDFLYIEDLITLYTYCINHPKAISGQIFNAGYGKEYTNKEVVQILFDSIQKTVPVNIGAYPARQWDTAHWIADTHYTQDMTKWKPAHTLSQGLKKTYEWLAQQPMNYDTQ